MVEVRSASFDLEHAREYSQALPDCMHRVGCETRKGFVPDHERRVARILVAKAIQQQVGGQATKGTRWMPWRQEAMKDVVSCDKLRGAANRLRSGDLRMGKPDGSHIPSQLG